MSDTTATAVEKSAEEPKEGFFKKLGKIPGANILVPLLSACIINTFFPQVFALGSFTTAMTTNGSGALVGAFLLIVGTTISFKSAPKAAARGAIIIITKVVFCVALAMIVLFACNDNLLGLSSMVILAACSGANNAMYAGLMGDYGSETERGAVAITTLIVGPPVTMIALGAAGQAPIGWSLLGAVLPIVVGIILGNCFPSLKATLSKALSGIIIIVFFAMGSTMTLGQIVNAGLPGILLGVICSVGGAVINITADRLTGGTGVAGAAISSCAGANVATPAAMASVNAAKYGGDILATATAQVAACAIVTAILTPLITSWAYKRFEGDGAKGAQTAKAEA
ncbi:MAG: 2-keto-3-deoxygluconate permease [Atopobiaceae bacterium]|jgi:2-keto-3-deoxygluconate permease|nr:2-keto-3-deoxygluconate permease [Atopobiaceae bacterium]MCI2172742.1 2-keto-3-deoxygluconate permease [Atopobiaceae bacterium]MCI2207049.1 2-keto-3-deoxygluconate permease [Atopobiaceae bacterium]